MSPTQWSPGTAKRVMADEDENVKIKDGRLVIKLDSDTLEFIINALPDEDGYKHYLTWWHIELLKSRLGTN